MQQLGGIAQHCDFFKILFFRRLILTLCFPWYSCCCHFYCPRKCFCLKPLCFQSLCTDCEYRPKVTLWRKQKKGGEKRKSYRSQKGGDLVKFNGFLHAGAHVGDSWGLPGLTLVALQRLKPREKQELKQGDRRQITFS